MLKSIKHIVISFAGLLIIWQLAYTFGGFNPTLFPSPLKVLEAFQELVVSGLKGSTSGATLISHIGASMGRFLIGYFIAVILGVLLGLIFGWFPRAFAYVNPVVQLLRPIAPVAWLPFIVLWVGIGNVPAIAIIFIAGFFIILLTTVTAVRNVDPIYLKVASNFNLSQFQTVIKVVFPAVFPQIANGLHLALSTCWIFLVSGEMVGAQSGLGFLIMDAKNCIRADALLATMITIGVIGLLLDKCIGFFEKWVAKNWGFGSVSNTREG
jgi:NitT/TauT family transport system permease protein